SRVVLSLSLLDALPSLSPVQASHPETDDVMRFTQRLLQRLDAQSGVIQAVAMTNLPVGIGATSQLQIGSLHQPGGRPFAAQFHRSEEHTSDLQSRFDIV